MANIKSQRVVDFKIVQNAIVSVRGRCQESSHGMKMEAMKRMLKRWEDD
jgi:hypothetical protein